MRRQSNDCRAHDRPNRGAFGEHQKPEAGDGNGDGNGSVNAERASGTMALTSNPAAANMSAWIALRTMGLSARRPRYCSTGIIRNAGVITATSPANRRQRRRQNNQR